MTHRFEKKKKKEKTDGAVTHSKAAASGQYVSHLCWHCAVLYTAPILIVRHTLPAKLKRQHSHFHSNWKIVKIHQTSTMARCPQPDDQDIPANKTPALSANSQVACENPFDRKRIMMLARVRTPPPPPPPPPRPIKQTSRSECVKHAEIAARTFYCPAPQ